MTRRVLVLLGILVLLGALTAAAQEATEFRGTGGELSMLPKRSSGFSGSLGLSLSQSQGALSGGDGKRYEGALGGSLVQDRLWFFASAEQGSSRLGPVVSQTGGNANAIDARVMANLGDRQNLAAIFSQNQQPATTGGIPGTVFTTPSTFLSMRYTGIVTDSMFFTASASRRTVTQRDVLFTPANAQ